MAQFLAPYTAQSYAALRIVAGFLFLTHGSQKLFSFPVAAMEGIPAFVQYGAGGIEFIGGVLIMIGLFTRWSAFICSGTMAAAYWMAHGLNALFPMQNGGELAVLYCFMFLFIAANGSGTWSVDAMRSSSE
ncbi:MAG: DoxX family protein [Gammaproteobacteria bacterium]|nr:DoxX family protein [Gammaproteobacteria bacterium]